MSEQITLGTRVCASPLHPAPPQVHWLNPELARHKNTPWLDAYLKERHGVTLPTETMQGRGSESNSQNGSESKGKKESDHGDTVGIGRDLLHKHALIVGATGSGKTRIVLHLLREQLRVGCSAVVVDFKPDTAREVVSLARQAGVGEEDISVLWTGEANAGVPGWNPLAVPLAQAGEAVRGVKDIFATAYHASWGARLDDLLENAATVICAQRLSFLELVRFLQSDSYRAGLLAQAQGTSAWHAFPEEHAYFACEFAGLSKGERATAIGPVLNKVRKLVTTPYLRALLCAREDTLRLETLWQRQRVVVVHLDPTALGMDGARLLSGMLCHRLYALCMRRSGNVGVQIVLDELGAQERFLGSAIRDIVERGRQQGLWLLTAGQHLGQISDELRALMLGNVGLLLLLRLGLDDAKKGAALFAMGVGERATRIALDVVEKRGEWEWETSLLPLVDGGGMPLVIPAGKYTQMQNLVGVALGEAVSAWGERIGQRAYVKLPGSRTRELREQMRQLPAETCLSIRTPPTLLVRFPRPKVTIEERESETERTAALAGMLAGLPDRQGIARASSGLRAHLLLAPMPPPANLPDVDGLLRGQDEAEVQDTYRARLGEIARLSGESHASLVPAAVSHTGRQSRAHTPAADPDFLGDGEGQEENAALQDGKAFPAPAVDASRANNKRAKSATSKMAGTKAAGRQVMPADRVAVQVLLAEGLPQKAVSTTLLPEPEVGADGSL